MILILEALYFFLPAGIANMFPVLFSKIPFLNKAVDFGAKFRGKRLFGANKTWRGVVLAVLGGMLTTSIQRIIGWDLSFFSYSESNFLLIGALLGFGAIFGDLIESLLKRQYGKKPGESWFPWDQLDYIIGGLLFVGFYSFVPLEAIIIIFVGYFLLHLLINLIGYGLNLRKSKI